MSWHTKRSATAAGDRSDAKRPRTEEQTAAVDNVVANDDDDAFWLAAAQSADTVIAGSSSSSLPSVASSPAPVSAAAVAADEDPLPVLAFPPRRGRAPAPQAPTVGPRPSAGPPASRDDEPPPRLSFARSTKAPSNANDAPPRLAFANANGTVVRQTPAQTAAPPPLQSACYWPSSAAALQSGTTGVGVIMMTPPPSSAEGAPPSGTDARAEARPDVRPGHEDKHPDVKCHCKRDTMTWIVRNGREHHGKRGYKCTQYKQPGGCDYWKWHDEYTGPPERSGQAPHYRENLLHDHLYGMGGRVTERIVRLTRDIAHSSTPSSSSSSSSDSVNEVAAASVVALSRACVEAVHDRWNVTTPVGTDVTETDAEGAQRLMPLIDLDGPMGRTAEDARHPHVKRTVLCASLFAHMAVLRGWTVTIQPPYMAFYQHVHMSLCKGPYDQFVHWVRVEPAQRVDLRTPNDMPVQYDLFWVPLTHSDPERPTWTTGSHVDIVVYERDDRLVLMDRRRLWRYIDRYVVSMVHLRVPAPTEGTADAPAPAVLKDGKWVGPTVSDPMQADHRVLDMGAIGMSPHERRTLLSFHTLEQHDAQAQAQGHADDIVICEQWLLDPVVAGPYRDRMAMHRSPPH